VNLGMAGQGRKGVQMHRCQGGETEQAHPFGQGAGRSDAPLDGPAKSGKEAGSVYPARPVHQGSP